MKKLIDESKPGVSSLVALATALLWFGEQRSFAQTLTSHL